MNREDWFTHLLFSSVFLLLEIERKVEKEGNIVGGEGKIEEKVS